MDEVAERALEAIDLEFERFVKERLGVDLDGTASANEICRLFLRGTCPRGAACPQRHSFAINPANRSERSVVCKHWLRGLCKKGDLCEYLHQYDLKRMPECWFFTKYGECSNPECLYLHVDPNSKSRQCQWYARGHCRHGAECKNKHVRNTACPQYLSGFCPFGPDCQFGQYVSSFSLLMATNLSTL